MSTSDRVREMGIMWRTFGKENSGHNGTMDIVAGKEAYLLLWEREEGEWAENPDISGRIDLNYNDEVDTTINRGEMDIEHPNAKNHQRSTTKSADQSKGMCIEEKVKRNPEKKGSKRSLEAQPNVLTGKEKMTDKAKVKRHKAEQVHRQENKE